MTSLALPQDEDPVSSKCFCWLRHGFHYGTQSCDVHVHEDLPMQDMKRRNKTVNEGDEGVPRASFLFHLLLRLPSLNRTSVMDTQELLASHMSGVQNCVVFSCQEIKPYGRPYARLTFLYVLLTATHVCMASLTLCLRQRYASPLWSHVLCCCKIPFSFHMIVLMQTVWFPACTLPFPWFQLSERKLLQICLGPAVMKVQ